MTTTIAPITVQPIPVQPSAAQPAATQLAAAAAANAQPVAAQPVAAQPVAAQPTVADDCLGTSVYTKVDVENQFGPFNLPAKANLIAAASLSTSTINPVVFDATAD